MKVEEAISRFKDEINGEGFYTDNAHREMAIEALEKQIPKKPIETKEMKYCSHYDCPSCEHSLYFDLEHVPDYYCRRCGQKIDWGEGDDD